MSWPKVSLGEAAEIIGGATPKSSVSELWDGPVLWATPTDLSRLKQKYIEQTERTISDEGLKSCAAKLLPPNSVLFSSRAPIGLVAINKKPMATNQGFKSFIPKPNLDSGYLYWWLKANREKLHDLGNGATFREVSKSVISRVSIPLPPLEEQRQIAAILDKADAIRRKREQALTLADDLLKSTFLEMFGDPVLNEKRLPTIALGELIKVSSGGALTAKNMNASGMYPVYGGNGINGYHSRYMFEEPRIVIGRVGIYCGAVHVTKPNSWVTDNALYVRQYKKPVEITYLEWALRFANLNQYAGRAAQPLISGSRIYPVEIVLPNLDEQKKFTDYQTKHGAIVTKLKADCMTACKLFSALSQRAFRGEL